MAVEVGGTRNVVKLAKLPTYLLWTGLETNQENWGYVCICAAGACRESCRQRLVSKPPDIISTRVNHINVRPKNVTWHMSTLYLYGALTMNVICEGM